MATYCVTYADDDNWGEARDRFKTRAAADARLAEARVVRPLVRLVRWQNNVPTEFLRETQSVAGAPTNRPADSPSVGRSRSRDLTAAVAPSTSEIEAVAKITF